MSLLGVAETRLQAKREFARAKRYGFPLTLAVCRIDRLDRLSDLYGRDSHALIQRELAKIFQLKSRSTDLVGRLSEDRILWILPHTDAEGALVAADRIREEVASLDLQSGTKAIRITLSIGISVHQGDDTLFLDTVLTLGETALERAHALGGNRCEVEKIRSQLPQDPELKKKQDIETQRTKGSS
jgi:diguanylate cyclase (GGDEF)-like protein